MEHSVQQMERTRVTQKEKHKRKHESCILLSKKGRVGTKSF